MTLKEKIEADIKTAMLARDKDGLRALRAVKAMILVEETKEDGTGTLTPEDETRLLAKAVKQRKDSADIYRQQDRQDLLDTELAELAIIERFLPKPLTEAEITERLRDIMARVGASRSADMGKVMGVATKELAGLADGKTVSALVKTLLA